MLLIYILSHFECDARHHQNDEMEQLPRIIDTHAADDDADAAAMGDKARRRLQRHRKSTSHAAYACSRDMSDAFDGLLRGAY